MDHLAHLTYIRNLTGSFKITKKNTKQNTRPPEYINMTFKKYAEWKIM